MNDPSQEQQQVLFISQPLLQQIPHHVQGCFSDDPSTQFVCVQRIRKLLAIKPPPIQQVIDSGVVPRIVQFLRFEQFPKIQFEAAWVLKTITSGTSEQIATVIRYGTVPIFIKLLQSKSNEVKEQSLWALGNIAGDRTETRNIVLSDGVLPILLPIFRSSKGYQHCLVTGYMAHEFLTRNKNYQYEINIIIAKYLCKEPEISILRKATWTLSNICRCKPFAVWKYVELAIEALTIMIKSEDDKILQNTCWAFSYLSDTEQQLDAIINSGCLYRIICLLDHENYHICDAALRIIGNIVTGSDQQTQSIINLGVLNKLTKLIKHDRATIKREVCWIISNITAGTTEQIEAVIKSNLFPALIHVLKYEKYEIAKEALWVIANASFSGTDKQIAFWVQKGVIQPLCQFFQLSIQQKMILVALEGIENILEAGSRLRENGVNQFAQNVEECGGVGYLQQLTLNETVSNQIYDKAISIIKEYFNAP